MCAAPVVSVVTPLYNGEEHLEECIRSVLRQSFGDWEYLICDNLSTDGSLAIADRYAALDSRVRVVRASEFVDVWRSHNRALRSIHRESRYCKILQADDLLYPQCLALMVEAAERHPSAGIVTSYRLLGDAPVHGGLFGHDEEVMGGREVIRRVLLAATPPWPDLGWVMGSPSSLLIRADLVRVRGEFYQPDFWHGDADAALRTMLDSDCAFVHQVLTFTRLKAGGLTSMSYRVNTFLAEQGWLLIRYGRQVLTTAERRTKLRQWLSHYGRLIGRKSLRPYRRQFGEFHRFHVAVIDRMLAEIGDDGETRAALSVLRALLTAAHWAYPGRGKQ